MPKRTDTLSWDEYFMGLAHLSALRSKDPNTQVGAAIVDENHRVVSVGYNGFPKGCSDDEFPWEREGRNLLEMKYAYAIGGDEISARRAGIQVDKVRFGVFVVNGMIAVIGGLCYACMCKNCSPMEYYGG